MRNNTPLAGHLLNPGNDAPVQIVAIVLVLGKWEHQGHQAASGTSASSCSTFADKHHPTDAWTRVFKPSHEILRENLPEPEV
jgi:hypothetical protein